MMFKGVEGGGVGEGVDTNAKINCVTVCHQFLNAFFLPYIAYIHIISSGPKYGI